MSALLAPLSISNFIAENVEEFEMQLLSPYHLHCVHVCVRVCDRTCRRVQIRDGVCIACVSTYFISYTTSIDLATLVYLGACFSC